MNNLAYFEKQLGEVFQNNGVTAAGDLLVEMIKNLLENNYTREEILKILDKFRVKFYDEGNEEAFDMILGIMDRVAGWTSSQFRL